MILISLFAAFLLWVLLAPVILKVDTARTLYRLTMPGVFMAKAIPAESLFRIRGWIFFIPFRFDPFRPGATKQRKERKKTGRKRKSFQFSALRDLASGFLGAIRIRKLNLDIDTEDPLLNTWLIPAFSSANSERIHLTANFEGNASLDMDIRTRLGSLAWVFVTNKYKSKFNR